MNEAEIKALIKKSVKSEVSPIMKEVVKEELPKLLGRSLLQVREYLISKII